MSTRHPPIKLTCQQCGAEFKRRYSYHHFLVEKRNITATFCSKRCKDISEKINVPDSIIEEYKQGYSLTEIGLHYNVSTETIRHRLIASGASLRTRNAHMLTDKNPTKGKGHTKDAKKKIREASYQQFSDPANRELASHNQCKAMTEGKVNPASKLEDRVAEELSNQGFTFIRQFGIRNPINGQYCACVDFMLADGRVIEVNGTYWHVDPRAYPNGPIHASQRRSLENYQKKVKALAQLSIPLIELWEMDLRTDLARTISNTLRSSNDSVY